MSYHRVLPPPSGLSTQDYSSRLPVRNESLRHAQSMTNGDQRDSPSVGNSLDSNADREDEALHSPLSYKQSRAPSIAATPTRASTTSSPHERSSAQPSPQHNRQFSTSSRSDEQDDSSGLSNRAPSPNSTPKPTLPAVDNLQADSPSQICLCQPDPKVPRPRNAFILYRQHHQASVVAQNPGLANPEISKVIANHWRQSSPEEKEHWKLLADEEKIRHQKQYPDYRYQPRRSGRSNSTQEGVSTPSASTASTQRCQKCGGKSIKSSTVMSRSMSVTAQASSNGFHTASKDNGFQAGAVPHSPSPVSGAWYGRTPTAPISSVHGSMQGRRVSQGQSLHDIPLASPRHVKRPLDLAEKSPASPDAKRRIAAGYSRGPQGPQTPFSFTPHGSTHPSLPRPEFMNSKLTSPTTANASVEQRHRRAEPLKLPPLYTAHVQDRQGHSHSSIEDGQSRALEAMIRSIPILHKLRVLSRISCPLPLNAAADSPSGQQSKGTKRGIIIAIDSVDTKALQQLTTTLEQTLMHEYDLKVFDTPRLPPDTVPSFQSYLQLVDRYHSLSQDVIAHVMPRETHESWENATSPMDSKKLDNSPLSPLSMPHSKPLASIPSPPAGTHPTSDERSTSARVQGLQTPPPTSRSKHPTNTSSPKALPIALIPSWHLTHTDAFSTTIPITDSYSPMDHWQWHATVWRGVVGADATIAVAMPSGHPSSPVAAAGPESAVPRSASSPPLHRGANSPTIEAIHRSNGSSSGSEGRSGARPRAPTVPSSNLRRDNSLGSLGYTSSGVEVRLDDAHRAVILQARESTKAPNANASIGEGGTGAGGVSDGALRRTAFELAEWVRGWSERAGGSGSSGNSST